jgi:hypothetical protein
MIRAMHREIAAISSHRSVIPERWVFPLGGIAAALLLAYLLNLLLKSRDPKLDSNGSSWLGMAAVFSGALLAILTVGLIFRIRLLVVIVTVVTLVPVIFLAPDVVRMSLRDWRQNRKNKP